jgi:hypothetical protein
MRSDYPPYFTERLRRAPSELAVGDSPAVLFFGSIRTATIATVGLNPSEGEFRGFIPRLSDLGAASRESLTREQCDDLITHMESYFDRKTYGFFRPQDDLLAKLGAGYREGSAVHLDLLQEPTKVPFSELLDWPVEASDLLSRDLPFLKHEIADSNITRVLCNGKKVFRAVMSLLGVPEPVPDKTQRETRQSFRFYGRRSVSFTGRTMLVTGWNNPLERAPRGRPADNDFARMVAEALEL